MHCANGSLAPLHPGQATAACWRAVQGPRCRGSRWATLAPNRHSADQTMFRAASAGKVRANSQRTCRRVISLVGESDKKARKRKFWGQVVVQTKENMLQSDNASMRGFDGWRQFRWTHQTQESSRHLQRYNAALQELGLIQKWPLHPQRKVEWKLMVSSKKLRRTKVGWTYMIL